MVQHYYVRDRLGSVRELVTASSGVAVVGSGAGLDLRDLWP
jgi:hypothetical protein